MQALTLISDLRTELYPEQILQSYENFYGSAKILRMYQSVPAINVLPPSPRVLCKIIALGSGLSHKFFFLGSKGFAQCFVPIVLTLAYTHG